MSDQKNTFFVIVTYNNADTIMNAIDSILASQDISSKIIMVDNASIDATVEKCENIYPHLTCIKNTSNKGFSSAANQGMRFALERGAEFVVLLNPDAVLEKNAVATLISEMNDKNIAISSPKIFHAHSSDIWFDGGEIDYFRLRAIHKKTKKRKLKLSPLFISGCAMVISSHTIKTIGFFDERFFLYYEDADYSLRAQKAGLTISISSHAHAYHHEVSEQNKPLKIYYLVLSGLLFFHKNTRSLMCVYFWVHFYLRRIKNFFDRLQKKEHAKIVYKAFADFTKTI